MSRKFQDGLERGRDEWRERTSVLTATPTSAHGKLPAPVTLHWTRHPEAVGYNLYRSVADKRGARQTRINGRRPIAPATTCAQFCAFVPKESDLWDRLCDGLSALSAAGKAEIEADPKGLARFKDDFTAARVMSRAMDPLSGSLLRDPLPDSIDPCEALERGLTREETALFDTLAHVDLRMRQARGLAFIDKTARAGTRYSYALTGIDRRGNEFLLVNALIVVAGLVVVPGPPSGIGLSAKDHKVLLLWNRNPRAHDYVVERAQHPGGPFQKVHASPIHYDINKDLDGVDLSPTCPGFLDYRRWEADGTPKGHDVDGVTVDGPANDTTYYYRVASLNINGMRGAWSAVHAATPVRTLPPQAPVNLTVTAVTGPKGLQLYWRKVTRDVEGHIIPDTTQTYEIYRAQTQTELSDLPTLLGHLLASVTANPVDTSVPTLTWMDTDPVLEPPYGEQDYCYRIVCIDTDGNRSAPSAIVSGRIPDTTPPGPTKVVGAEGHEAHIRIFWEPNSEPDVAGYLIYRGVCDHNTVGPDEEDKRKTCDMVLVAQVTAKEAKERKEATGQAWGDDTSVPEGSPICYGFWVRAYDAAQNLYPGVHGCPASSDEYACARLIEKTPPPVPVITGLAAGERSVEIEWIASPVQDQRAFHIYRSDTENGPLTFVGCVLLDGTVHPGRWTGAVPNCNEIPAEAPNVLVRGKFTDKGLRPDEIYWYRVSALDWLGNESQGDDLSQIPAISTFAFTQVLPVTPSLEPPGPQAAQGCGLTVRWQPAIAVADVAGFVVFRRAGTGAWRQVSGIVTGNAFDDVTALRGVSYNYRVQSIDARGRLSKASAPVAHSF
jgi:fibronectin type 3 domain-containing protein